MSSTPCCSPNQQLQLGQDRTRIPTSLLEQRFPSMATLIDSNSVKKYTQEAESARQKFVSGEHVRNHMEAHVEREIQLKVDEKCSHRTMDLSSVTLATCSSAVVPFTGVAVMLTATVVQCVSFSSALGLIPLTNVSSLGDLGAMSAQAGKTIQEASGAGLHAGIEAAVLEILKHLGVDKWLWDEILKDILFEMVGECAFEAAWILGPLFLSLKYKLHRGLSKKMYKKLGDKARKVHFHWVDHNLLQQTGHCTTSPGQHSHSQPPSSWSYAQQPVCNSSSSSSYAYGTTSTDYGYSQPPWSYAQQPQAVSSSYSSTYCTTSTDVDYGYIQPPSSYAQQPVSSSTYCPTSTDVDYGYIQPPRSYAQQPISSSSTYFPTSTDVDYGYIQPSRSYAQQPVSSSSSPYTSFG